MLTHIKPVPILCCALLTTALVLTPYKLACDSRSLHLQAQLAWAKDGGKGGGGGGANNGNGGGNSGNAGGKGGNSGNGGDKGGPNAGGNSGSSGDGGNSGNNGGRKGGGNSGDSDTSGDKGTDSKNTSAGNSGDVHGGKVNQSAPAQSVAIDGSAMEVRHWNGMSERIKDGRYVMKDAKGRTIINRTATTSDQSRLRSFDR